MNAGQLIREIMKNKGFSGAALSQKMGFSLPTYVINKISRGNSMRVDSLLEMLEAMDCEVIIKNKIGKKEQWVLTREAPKE